MVGIFFTSPPYLPFSANNQWYNFTMWFLSPASRVLLDFCEFSQSFYFRWRRWLLRPPKIPATTPPAKAHRSRILPWPYQVIPCQQMAPAAIKIPAKTRVLSKADGRVPHGDCRAVSSPPLIADKKHSTAVTGKAPLSGIAPFTSNNASSRIPAKYMPSDSMLPLRNTVHIAAVVFFLPIKTPPLQ